MTSFFRTLLIALSYDSLQKVLVYSLCGLALVVVSWYFWWYSPQLMHLEQTRQQVAQLQLERNTLLSLQDKLHSVRLKNQILYEEIKRSVENKKASLDSQIQAVLFSIPDEGVATMSCRPARVIVKEFYNKQEVEFHMIAPYETIMNFLQSVSLVPLYCKMSYFCLSCHESNVSAVMKFKLYSLLQEKE